MFSVDMDKVVDYDAIEHLFHDEMTLMIAGFLANGTPEGLISFILEKGWKHLKIITNDGSFPDKGFGRLISADEDVVDEVTSCHIGTNKVLMKRFNEGTIKVNFIPQGTLVEAIRAKGCGLGGVLTPVGVGTELATGRQILTIKGKDYLLEEPLSAEVAIIKGSKVDRFGNIIYHGASRNYNTAMAMAGDNVVCEAEEIVEIGTLNKDYIHTPGVFVDYVVPGRQN